MNAIIGTAGHIDHGKSALVRALTGIETDRLIEERERGISIELGFAHMALPGDVHAGIVDVPGHERFIRQMLAGAHGFDLVLLVVAADDGVMPQTEEHFEIVHLLGVPRAVFVITKSDVVEASRIDDVRDEIEILAVGTPFEDAPVVAVSAIGGEGIEELRGRIAEAVSSLGEAASDTRPLRIPVDRAFVMKGHGVVVTGTALAGSVAPGDEIEIAPSGRSARVRDVQVHGEPVQRALGGQRVALNLAGVEKGDVERGDTIVKPGTAVASARFDARVEVRPMAGRAVESYDRVRVYCGTREAHGRIIWLDAVERVEPRESAFCQIVLSSDAVLGRGDRFVLRDETAQRTLGGGSVLLAQAERHRRSAGDVGPLLAKLERGNDLERVEACLAMAPELGAQPEAVATSVGLSPDELRAAVAGSGGGAVVALPDAERPTVFLARSRHDTYVGELIATVGTFHRDHPEQAGIDLEHLRGSVRPTADARTFRMLLDTLIEAGRLARRGSVVFLPGHEVSVGAGDEAVVERIADAIVGAGAMPPTLKQLGEELGVDARRSMTLAGVLVERGRIVKVATDLFFGAEVLVEVERSLREYLERESEISASGFRDLIGASRKYCIPLLDYFDRSGTTVRVGDVRRLRA